MRMNKILQSGLAIVLAICLLLPGGFFSEAALAEDTTMDGTVRVYLSSLGSPSRLDITICGQLLAGWQRRDRPGQRQHGDGGL